MNRIKIGKEFQYR